MVNLENLTYGPGLQSLLLLVFAILYTITASTGSAMYTKCGEKKSDRTFLTINTVTSALLLLFASYLVWGIIR